MICNRLLDRIKIVKSYASPINNSYRTARTFFSFHIQKYCFIFGFQLAAPQSKSMRQERSDHRKAQSPKIIKWRIQEAEEKEFVDLTRQEHENTSLSTKEANVSVVQLLFQIVEVDHIIIKRRTSFIPT
ncbi:hypothetical protein RCL_jg25096.t1 [Rhizophagus clarus]|uniref:Uncharacterized protein n=1 Tax=Rhizophagus clarus TaxID=94130 RepID=A0A8H3QVU3_9GLOM|nr:hypothetical protein RCL_jg25096.t1 [Rhizophagus clarus]